VGPHFQNEGVMKFRVHYLFLGLLLGIWLTFECANFYDPGVFSDLEKHWKIDGGKLRLGREAWHLAFFLGKSAHLIAGGLTAVFAKQAYQEQKAPKILSLACAFTCISAHHLCDAVSTRARSSSVSSRMRVLCHGELEGGAALGGAEAERCQHWYILCGWAGN
jgi:hypothetical protein